MINANLYKRLIKFIGPTQSTTKLTAHTQLQISWSTGERLVTIYTNGNNRTMAIFNTDGTCVFYHEVYEPFRTRHKKEASSFYKFIHAWFDTVDYGLHQNFVRKRAVEFSREVNTQEGLHNFVLTS